MSPYVSNLNPESKLISEEILSWGGRCKIAQKSVGAPPGTLENIASIAAHAKLEGPAIVIIGTVVSLRDQLTWYGSTS